MPLLPNGKLIQHNNNLYQSNLLRLLTETDYNTLNNNINSSINSSVVFGNYTGNSTAYNYNPRTISLGFTPKAIISLSTMGQAYYSRNSYNYSYGGIATTNSPIVFPDSENNTTRVALNIVNNGFQVYRFTIGENVDYVINTNLSGVEFVYIAFR